jgi:hypothetical protein
VRRLAARADPDSARGIELHVLELAPPGAASHTVGARIRAGWQAEHGCFLSA